MIQATSLFICVGCILAFAEEKQKVHFGGKASKGFCKRDKDLMPPCENHRSEVDILQKMRVLGNGHPGPIRLSPLIPSRRSLSSALYQTIATR